jgi:glycosyltransferase involved in cell wall biosynthesis
VRGFDIIQLHWVSNFLNYRRFFQNVPGEVPLVWRFADMNPLTGGCHYDGDCGRFAESCGECPKLQSHNENDLSRAIWERKKSGLAHLPSNRLHIVALNSWMAEQVRRSSLFKRFECSIIPNGVDLEEFRPVPQGIAREALGIPAGRQVLAFVAESAANVRKGFHLLCGALEKLKTRSNLFLLIVGDSPHAQSLNVPALRVGFVQSPLFLRQIYSAADLFAIPSLEDNQPNTVLEAMACGTPVVGFKAGGIPEMIDHGKTGLLVPRGDVQELALAIESLLNDERLRATMGTLARKRAEAVFSRDGQVRQYLELYSRLLVCSKGARAEVAGTPNAKEPGAFRTARPTSLS